MHHPSLSKRRLKSWIRLLRLTRCVEAQGHEARLDTLLAGLQAADLDALRDILQRAPPNR